MAKSNGAGKDKAIDLAISQIEKQFGQGSIMRLGGDDGGQVGRRSDTNRRSRTGTSPLARAGSRGVGSSRFTVRKDPAKLH